MSQMSKVKCPMLCYGFKSLQHLSLTTSISYKIWISFIWDPKRLNDFFQLDELYNTSHYIPCHDSTINDLFNLIELKIKSNLQSKSSAFNSNTTNTSNQNSDSLNVTDSSLNSSPVVIIDNIQPLFIYFEKHDILKHIQSLIHKYQIIICIPDLKPTFNILQPLFQNAVIEESNGFSEYSSIIKKIQKPLITRSVKPNDSKRDSLTEKQKFNKEQTVLPYEHHLNNEPLVYGDDEELSEEDDDDLDI